VRLIRQGPIVDSPSTRQRRDGRPSQDLVLRLNEFTRDALMEESDRLGVSTDDLAVFAILYYLADLDSKRIARRIPTASQSPAGRQD
jgi:hypothetical protein